MLLIDVRKNRAECLRRRRDFATARMKNCAIVTFESSGLNSRTGLNALNPEYDGLLNVAASPPQGAWTKPSPRVVERAQRLMRNLSNGVGMMDGGRAAAIPVDLAPAGGNRSGGVAVVRAADCCGDDHRPMGAGGEAIRGEFPQRQSLFPGGREQSRNVDVRRHRHPQRHHAGVAHPSSAGTEGVTDRKAAVIRGATERLLPILMTALAAGLALVPIALSAGEPGSEIQALMAMVIMFGLASSTALNMIVVPIVHERFGRPSGPVA